MNTPWREEHLYFDGDAYFDDVIAAINGARQSVDVEVYIYRDDVLGEAFATALEGAARRGVRARVLADGFGSAVLSARMLDRFALAGIDFRFYNPLRFWWRINRRDHRKLFLVDNETAWVGSPNVTAPHLSVKRGGDAWRDTGVRVRGGAIELIVRSFEQVWRGQLRALPPSRWLRLNMTRKLRFSANMSLLRRIARAERRIWITSAYFVPRTLVTLALKSAASRGVDVRVLVPQVSDVFFVPWLTRLYSVFLISFGVRFFEYVPSVLHAKSAIIDDWTFVGSSNFNHRSFIHDLELDVVLSRPESINAMAAQFEKDCRLSSESKGGNAHKGFIGIIARLLWRFRRYS